MVPLGAAEAQAEVLGLEGHPAVAAPREGAATEEPATAEFPGRATAEQLPERATLETLEPVRVEQDSVEHQEQAVDTVEHQVRAVVQGTADRLERATGASGEAA